MKQLQKEEEEKMQTSCSLKCFFVPTTLSLQTSHLRAAADSNNAR